MRLSKLFTSLALTGVFMAACTKPTPQLQKRFDVDAAKFFQKEYAVKPLKTTYSTAIGTRGDIQKSYIVQDKTQHLYLGIYREANDGKHWGEIERLNGTSLQGGPEGAARVPVYFPTTTPVSLPFVR